MGKLIVNMVIDKSGSMANKRTATIESVRGFLDGLRESEHDVLVSETQFSTTFDVKFVGVPLDGLPTFADEGHEYAIGGGTALFDAVAVTVKGVEAWLAKHSDFDGKVLTVIQTDGEENSSKEWTLTAINDLIDRKRADGWEFQFAGAGQEAWEQGQAFTSIPQENYFNYEGTSVGSTQSSSIARTSSSLAYAAGGSAANVSYAGVAPEALPDEEGNRAQRRAAKKASAKS